MTIIPMPIAVQPRRVFGFEVFGLKVKKSRLLLKESLLSLAISDAA
jgi:hypothetical protein